MLNQNIFTNIISKFGFQPGVDLFTSRLNAQIPLFVSYHPSPEAIYINAFSIPWREMHRPFHEFTHFVVIRRVLHKKVLDVATGIIVVPNWHSQPWYSLLMKLLIVFPILLYSSKTLLQNPTKSKPHPIANRLNLLARMISCKNQEQQTIQQRALGSPSREQASLNNQKMQQLHWEMESVLL